jgi:glycosyltransferase involved in cell wall biosynthesis
MDSYQLKAAISHFSQEWAQRRWGINCEVIHPPVDCRFGIREKGNVVLSVGRFAIEGEGHRKKQAEMLRAFRELEWGGLEGWSYVSVGGLGNTVEHQAFLKELGDMTQGCHAQILPNLPRERLRTLYEGAAIFWHAAGYNEDLAAHPELAEHFGLSTVEAMAAGCVPIVIDRGGQRDIVEHGVTGFRWSTLEELKAYSLMVIRDRGLRARMSEASRARAGEFSRERFIERFRQLLQRRGQG